MNSTIRALVLVSLAASSAAFVACSKVDEPTTVPLSSIPGHDGLNEDNTLKEGPRMVPPEAYIRTYLHIFGGLSPIAAQTSLRGADGSALFDTWNDYLSSLGLPDYRVDQPRGTQTNTLMLATFERLGVVLCDRALEKDLQGTPPPVGQRLVYDFDKPTGTVDLTAFAPRFDVLHRTFLGYPAALGPANRTADFFKLYQDTVADHAKPDAGKFRFKPDEAGWAAVCYGLVRHPEFHLY